MNVTTSPIMRQFLALKREIPTDAILLFRLGDFYETFGEDAAVSSAITGAQLTVRGGTQMCGFPAYRLDTFLAKFIRVGKTVAIADYSETAKRGKLTRREIIRLVTPGTAGEEGVE